VERDRVRSRYDHWRPYVSVGTRRARANRESARLSKTAHGADPVVIEGRKIARTFWGDAWCKNLERYSDYSNRLPRGRSYVRNGLVLDLRIAAGKVSALVSGSSIYEVDIALSRLDASRWKRIQEACAGRIESVVELLQGKLSGAVLGVLTAAETGLFPSPKEIRMQCSCPDYATMCKHVAAVLYGIGARLDTRPELFFVLRNVDQADLVGEAALGSALSSPAGDAFPALESAEMGRLFGIELEEAPRAAPRRAAVPRRGLKPGSRRSARRPSQSSFDMRIETVKRHLESRKVLRNADYCRLFSVQPIVATRELAKLVEREILRRKGAKRGAHYVEGPGIRST
jgi:uncharacterized Zn finger protein